VIEGRTESVNQEIARIAMATQPADIQRNAHMIERARQAAAQTAAARTGAVGVGAGAGLLTGTAQGAGPADRIMNGLLGGP